MATPESKVKKRVIDTLKKLGAYYFSPVTSGYGHSGVPDIIGCYKGRFFGIECKAGCNLATALQLAEITKIHKAGGAALIVYEISTEEVVETMLNML